MPTKQLTVVALLAGQALILTMIYPLACVSYSTNHGKKTLMSADAQKIRMEKLLMMAWSVFLVFLDLHQIISKMSAYVLV